VPSPTIPIPSYRRTEQLAPLPGERAVVRPDDSLSAVGQAVGQAGDVAQGIYLKEKKDTQDAQIADAYKQLAEQRIAIEGKYRALKGSDALETDVTSAAAQEVEKAAGDISANVLKDDRTRAVFRQRFADPASIGVRDAIAGHVAQQNDVFKAQSWAGARAVSVDLGVQAVGAAPAGAAADSKELTAARDGVLSAVTMQTKQMPPEAQAAERTAALTDLHAKALDRLLADQRPADAERYLTRWRGEMDPTAVGKADAALRQTSQGAAVEAKATSIMKDASITGYTWKDPAKALAAVEAIPDDDPTKPHVRQLVEQQVSKAEQLRTLAGKEQLNLAQSLLSKGAPLEGAAIAPIKAWMLDPANGAAGLWEVLQRNDAAEARAARAANATDRAAAAARREQAEADKLAVETYRSLDLKGSDGQDQLTIDLAQAFPDVSPTGRALLQIEKKKAEKEWGKDQGRSRTQFLDQVTNVATAFKYAKGAKGKSGDFEQFSSYMLDQLGQWQEANPTKPAPTQPDVDGMILNAVSKWESGSTFTANKEHWKLARARSLGDSAHVLPDTEQPDAVKALRGPAPAPGASPATAAAPGGIPADVRKALVEKFKSRGVDPTDEQLAAAYARLQGGQ
jgi:hypothetical protein